MLCGPEDSNKRNGFLFGHRKYHPRIINCRKQFVYLLIMFKTLIQLNSSVDTLLLKYTSCLVSQLILNIYKIPLWFTENSTHCYYIFIASSMIFKYTDVIISFHTLWSEDKDQNVWIESKVQHDPAWLCHLPHFSPLSFWNYKNTLTFPCLFLLVSPFHLSNLSSSHKFQFHLLLLPQGHLHWKSLFISSHSSDKHCYTCICEFGWSVHFSSTKL